MAINTIKATIQMRRGAEEHFDPDQMTAGEWAVSIDSKKVWMCFAPGIVRRMATYEAFEEDMLIIQQILATCQDIQEAVEAFEALAAQHEKKAKEYKDAAAASASEADSYYKLSKSYAVGTGGEVREGDDSDNSKYYYQQSKRLSQGYNGIIPMGTIAFADLADPENQIPKYMFNISDAFTSDERFADGGGKFYGAGNNVVFTASEKWDVLATSAVTGIKGDAEKEYRQGNVNITASDVGIENATEEKAGIVKPDGETTAVDPDGTLRVIGNEGTINYNDLENKPSINNVTLEGNKTLSQLGGASIVEITKAEYDAAKANGTLDAGTMYMIKNASKQDVETVKAENVTYDNADSGMAETNVQDVIDTFADIIIPSTFRNLKIDFLSGTESSLQNDLLGKWPSIPTGKGVISVTNKSTEYIGTYEKNGAGVGSISLMSLAGSKFIFSYQTSGATFTSGVDEIVRTANASNNEGIINWGNGSAYVYLMAVRHGKVVTLNLQGSFSIEAGSTIGKRNVGILVDPLLIPLYAISFAVGVGSGSGDRGIVFLSIGNTGEIYFLAENYNWLTQASVTYAV